MNILIVEDSKAEAHILAQSLERIMPEDKPAVYHRATLAATMELLKSCHGCIDLVFLDLKLSDSPEWKDTFGAVEPYVREIPVIVMSGNEDRDVAKELIARGAEDFIIKGGKKRHLDMLKEAIEFAMLRHGTVRKLTRKSEEEEQCIHWLTGGYSVE